MAKKNAKAKRQMDFGQRLAGFRKGLTQQALAELVNVHVIQVRRYGVCREKRVDLDSLGMGSSSKLIY